MAGPWAAYALVTDISIMAGVDREEFWSAEGYARLHARAIQGPVSEVKSRRQTVVPDYNTTVTAVGIFGAEVLHGTSPRTRAEEHTAGGATLSAPPARHATRSTLHAAPAPRRAGPPPFRA